MKRGGGLWHTNQERNTELKSAQSNTMQVVMHLQYSLDTMGTPSVVTRWTQ